MHITNIFWFQLLYFFGCIASGYVSGDRYYYKKCKPEAREPFSYRGKNGPYHWGETFPNCNGEYQSPVAINTHEAVFDEKLPKLKMKNYDIPVTKGYIENDGTTVRLNATDGIERTIVVNGEIYRLTQLHFHWGDSYYKGAEHVVDETQYAMEMHLVHQNAKEEIAVVAVLFKEQNKDHPELQKIVDHFPAVEFRDQRIPLKSKVKIEYLLPDNPSSFYRYYGSLTAPPCDEGVVWSILARVVPVGFKQMEVFRSLNTARKSEADWKCKLVNNFRPCQPLNYRKVFVSQ